MMKKLCVLTLLVLMLVILPCASLFIDASKNLSLSTKSLVTVNCMNEVDDWIFDTTTKEPVGNTFYVTNSSFFWVTVGGGVDYDSVLCFDFKLNCSVEMSNGIEFALQLFYMFYDNDGNLTDKLFIIMSNDSMHRYDENQYVGVDVTFYNDSHDFTISLNGSKPKVFGDILVSGYCMNLTSDIGDVNSSVTLNEAYLNCVFNVQEGDGSNDDATKLIQAIYVSIIGVSAGASVGAGVMTLSRYRKHK